MSGDVALYRRIYAILVGLTALTVSAWAAGGGSGRIVAVTVALSIAVVKASLIGLYFMHLKDEHPYVWAVVGLGLVTVTVLAVGIFPDVAVRAGS